MFSGPAATRGNFPQSNDRVIERGVQTRQVDFVPDTKDRIDTLYDMHGADQDFYFIGDAKPREEQFSVKVGSIVLGESDSESLAPGAHSNNRPVGLPTMAGMEVLLPAGLDRQTVQTLLANDGGMANAASFAMEVAQRVSRLQFLGVARSDFHTYGKPGQSVDGVAVQIGGTITMVNSTGQFLSNGDLVGFRVPVAPKPAQNGTPSMNGKTWFADDGSVIRNYPELNNIKMLAPVLRRLDPLYDTKEIVQRAVKMLLDMTNAEAANVRGRLATGNITDMEFLGIGLATALGIQISDGDKDRVRNFFNLESNGNDEERAGGAFFLQSLSVLVTQQPQAIGRVLTDAADGQSVDITLFP